MRIPLAAKVTASQSSVSQCQKATRFGSRNGQIEHGRTLGYCRKDAFSWGGAHLDRKRA